MSNDERGGDRLRVLSALLLVGVFAAGLVAGIGVCRWLTAAPAGPPPPPRGGLVHELGLDADQLARWRVIEERHRPELEAIVEESKPRVRQIVDQMDEELRQLLTPAQRQQFDQLKAHRPPLPPGGLPPPLGGPPPGAPPPPPGAPPPP